MPIDKYTNGNHRLKEYEPMDFIKNKLSRRRRLIVLLLIGLAPLLYANAAAAAPYHFNAPLNAYTWGESAKQAWQTLTGQKLEIRYMSAPYEQTIYVEDNYSHQPDAAIVPGKLPLFFLRFRADKLIAMEYTPLADIDSRGSANYAYQRLLERFTEQVGQPEEAPCLGGWKNCQSLRWSNHPTTMMIVVRSTAPDETIFTYSYVDKSEWPAYEQEVRQLGVILGSMALLHIFKTDAEYAQSVYGELKVRTALLVATVEKGGFSAFDSDLRNMSTVANNPGQRGPIVCHLRPGQDTRMLKPGKLIWISGVVKSYSPEGGLLIDEASLLVEQENLIPPEVPE